MPRPRKDALELAARGQYESYGQLLPNRLDVVLRVVYLVFNEGYTTPCGTTLMRHVLSSEAIPRAAISGTVKAKLCRRVGQMDEAN
jgi:hypothetical protein